MIIAVNWTGVYIVDDQEHVLLECSFPEITECSCNFTARGQGQAFTLNNIRVSRRALLPQSVFSCALNYLYSDLLVTDQFVICPISFVMTSSTAELIGQIQTDRF